MMTARLFVSFGFSSNSYLFVKMHTERDWKDQSSRWRTISKDVRGQNVRFHNGPLHGVQVRLKMAISVASLFESDLKKI